MPEARQGILRRLVALALSEPGRFGMVGIFNTGFGYGLFALLHVTIGTHVHYMVVLVIAQVVGVLEAYVTQRWLVFKARGRWWRDLVRFSSVYAVGLAVNMVALPLLVEVVRVPVMLAQLFVIGAVAVGTFTVHRLFTFKHSRAGAMPSA